MNNKDRYILYENKNEFRYDQDEKKISINFNRVAFIFFSFFYYFIDLFNSFDSSRFKKF